jgi:hypothetical protein
MALSSVATVGDLRQLDAPPDAYSDIPRVHTSGVSWSAIFAGAAAAAALSLILLMLGIGLGLSTVSPWARDGVSSTTFGVSTILWITLTQIVASGMGGYLAGRLRTRWVAVHGDEVYFRDTAHGFLAWAIASLATAALLTSAIGSMINGGLQAGATVVAGTAVGAGATGALEIAKSDGDAGPTGYFVESLFRRDVSATTVTAMANGPVPNNSSEVSHIFLNTIRDGPLAAEDAKYVGQLVAQRTGLTQQEAEKRVADTYTRLQAKLRDTETAVKLTADKARKASAYAALWLFISLLIGAFVASLAATYGGRRRDA